MTTEHSMPCAGCRNGQGLDFNFSMAFQPIVDIDVGEAFAYEALIRGPEGQPAYSVLNQVSPETRYAFDQQCRVKAIEGAARAGLLNTPARLSINFLPNAVYSPQACIQLTLKTAAAQQFPLERLIFEFTENEEMDAAHVDNIVSSYKKMGFATALDDFGAGHAGLALLAKFQPDFIKLDMELVRGIDDSLARRTVVGSVVAMCSALGIRVIAEGVETENEHQTLLNLGIQYIQGYLFAKPGFETLPPIQLPQLANGAMP